jgi:hypothetical protein
MWVYDNDADRKIRRMLNSYARAQVGANGLPPYKGPLLEFTGMTLEEFEMWVVHGLVSDRWLRMDRHGDDSGHRGEWLTTEQAKTQPTVAAP